MNKKNKNMKYSQNDKVTYEPDLELERKQATTEGKDGYNFIPSFNQWTSTDDQKVKTREIENKTGPRKV